MSIVDYSAPASTVFQGLESALERITGESMRSDQIAIGESLFWGITLDELLYKTHGTPYVDARDADPLGGCVNGARLARNAITHGAVLVQSIQGGLTFPLSFPLMFGEPAWLPVDRIMELASPPTSKRLAAQQASYATHFATRKPAEPPRQLRDWIVVAADAGFLL
ncbi:hypothetical protein [Leifsonia aquatica]|uniref:Uncharacterized protein n=1 Tax=Leifsonia aquatica TaxID=144185 RepID=A0A7W4USR8_LEIAQ|nr:hypothetical protein [Leifsonia aquatica]MBB2965593.1 hypothetical protein [Leifsonia aquatica]